MSTGIDYESVEVPDDQEPEDYSWQARRAEILQKLKRAGHPRLLNQRQLAERYDCSPPNINNDLGVLADYVDENLGSRRAMISEMVFHRAIQELLENEEYRKAAKTVREWNEWVDEYQDLQELRERMDRIEAERHQSGGDR